MLKFDSTIQKIDDYTIDCEKYYTLANSVLEKFLEISSVVQEKLRSHGYGQIGNIFASDADAARGAISLGKSLSTTYQEYKKTELEPAIAKIVIQYVDTKEIETFYITRGYIPTGIKNLRNNYSPMGRLATLQVGEIYDLGEETLNQKYEGKDILIVQNSTFIPVRKGELWDSRKTEYRDAINKNILTINSLLELLKRPAKDDKDILAQILAEESQEDNFYNGIRRDILETLSLRDQPVLDQYQDKIFRLPLRHSLLLLGPAGTGKTTTLIRRLGQKLNKDYGLSDEERSLVENLSDVSRPHETSWLMFTPKELLKSYLQESFNREGIPAPDHNITTWDTYKYTLGKDIFRILYTPNFESGYQYDADCITITDGIANSINIYNDFYTWIISDYTKDMLSAFDNIKNIDSLKDNSAFMAIHNTAKKYLLTGNKLSLFLRDTLKYKDDISKIYSKIKKKIDNIIEQELNRELNKNPKFLHNLSNFLKSLKFGEEDGVDEQDGVIVDFFEEEEELSLSNLKRAQVEYRRFLLTISRHLGAASKRTLSTKTLALEEWLGKNRPNEQVLSTLQRLAFEATALNSLNNPINKFFSSINVKYRKFRKLRQAENIWYNPDSTLRKKIDATELDILILTNLAISNELLSFSNIYRNISDSWLTALARIKNYYVNQVLVDEAPDFSPLQLSCMRLLTHPQVNSFFACGDFNQRLTSVGTKNIEELKTIIPWKSIAENKINIPYRQNKNLYEFSLGILKMITDEAIENTTSQSFDMRTGFSPVLGEKLKDMPLAIWIADRITEIEKYLHILPSIAILVPEEKYVIQTAQNLQKALDEKTTAIVQACIEGQTRGNEKAIRVFDIKHIKGLEFEVAFFVALDRLESIYPNLLGNYLYVGTTRAAEFLGVTYEQFLPNTVDNALRHSFVDTWNISY